MNILLVLLIVFVIDQSCANKLSGINVLETIKTKHSSCNLRDFVQSVDNSDDDYEVFIRDLTEYCSTTKSIPLYNLLCRIISIELEIACELSVNFRPPPVKYSTLMKSSEICSMTMVESINNWIWQKLTIDDKEEIGSSSTYLCSVLTASNSTLRLTRFFYKIAPRIRRADLRDDISNDNKNFDNSFINKIQVVEDKLSKKTNKTSNILPRINHNRTKLVEKQTRTKINKIKPIEPELNKDEGVPLGREGQNPGNEQINERPKPKALEVEMAFKANDNEERNWVEGKHNLDQIENYLQKNITKHLPHIKSDNKPTNHLQLFRQKLSSKLRPNKYHDDDDIIDHFTTIFLLMILCIIIIYLILRNKNKVLGLIIEIFKGKHGDYNRRIRLSQPK